MGIKAFSKPRLVLKDKVNPYKCLLKNGNFSIKRSYE